MFRNSEQKGFGLIELLIVLAIIGILIGLVLVQVTKSRQRSEDVRVTSGIRQLRVLAESYFTVNNNSYAGFDTCIDTPTPTNCLEQSTSDSVTTLIADIEEANAQSNTVGASANEPQFCIAAPLRSDATRYVCADASGEVQEQESVSHPCAGSQPACIFD